MISLAQFIQAFIGSCDHNLRSIKGLSLFERPGESVRMNSHKKSQTPECIAFAFCYEIAAVDKRHTYRFAGKIICFRPFDNHERILICTGYSAFTLNRNTAGRKFLYHRNPLSGPCSGKLHPFILLVSQIKAHAECTSQFNLCCSFI